MKSNWFISTSNGKFVTYRKTLKALGYEIHMYCEEADVNYRGYIALLDRWSEQSVQRSDRLSLDSAALVFQDMESFLDFHFKEKTKDEKELDKLNQQLVELQAQINVVKQSINK